MLIVLLHAIMMWQATTKVCGCAPGSEAWGCCGGGTNIQSLSYPAPFHKGDCFEAVSDTVLERSPCPVYPTSAVVTIVPTLDEPPLDKPAGESYWGIYEVGRHYETEYPDTFLVGVSTSEAKIFTRVCADKSRFMLKSTDGKWHCLALNR
jgi:hypothetical protein